MIKYDGLMTIDIRLENGVYAFNTLNGTGKTKLFNMLRSLQTLGEPILTYTYYDKTVWLNPRALADRIQPKLIMFDRADMYRDDKEFRNTLIDWRDKAIILVSMKIADVLDVKWKLVGIELTDDRILVAG